MLDDFLTRAAVAGVGVAIAAALIGCFVVWRRMAYFGDATSHGAILGVALSLGFGLPIYGGVFLVAVAMVLVLTALTGRGHSMDTVLGVLAHAALAFGLVAVSFLPGVRIDLEAYLFGDILAVSKADLGIIWAGTALLAGYLGWRWQALLTSTLNEDLAISAGLNPKREMLGLTLALALVVAFAIKVVGALLITALLIIPAASARPFATTPERMALVAVVLGIGSALGGLWLSLLTDAPTGPMIVCAAALIFATSQAVRALKG